MTPVRADDGEEVELVNGSDGNGGGGGGGGSGENPEEEMVGGEDEELPSAMAAAQHGITVKENGGSKTEVSESGSGSEKGKGLENLDHIIGSDDSTLAALISPRPGDKGAAPSDEGKVADEVKEEEEGKTSA